MIDNEFLDQKKEIDQEYEKCQKILLELNEKKEKSLKELEDSQSHHLNMMKELSEINLQIEKYKTELNLFVNENPIMGLDEIEKKCHQVINKFINNTSNSNENNNQTNKKISFKIVNKSASLSKKIEDDTITFERLKLETAQQFDKNVNEFFFANENGEIYLDELNVKNALFSLENINIKNFEPSVKVVDKKNLDLIENSGKSSKREKNDEKNIDNGGLSINNNKLHQIKETVINFLKENKFRIIRLVFFIIFISCFIVSSINFRKINERNILKNGFIQGMNEEQYIIQKQNPNDLLPYIRQIMNQTLQLDKTPAQRNWFNVFNNNMNYMKLIQTRYKQTTCTFNRFTFNASNTYCLDPSSDNSNKDMYFYNSVNSTYYNSINSNNLITGIYQNYDDSGYNATISLLSYNQYITDFDRLISNSWVDQNTKSLMMIVNFYNINFDLYFTVRILFENVHEAFVAYIDYSLLNLTRQYDPYMIASVVFSFLCVFLLVYSLMKESPVNKPVIEDSKRKIELKCVERLKTIFCTICVIIENNFRFPNIFEAIAFLNYIFFWGVSIYRMNYFNYINNNFVINTNLGYTDFSYLSLWFDLITYLNCGIIILFIFNMISNLSWWIDELRIISEALLSYMYKITLFSLGFGVLFIVYSNYIAFFIWGDFHMFYYKDYKFIFLKILSMFYRGSIDNSDFDDSINRYKLTQNSTGDAFYLYLIKDSINPYLSISNHSYYFTFFFFTLIFYFVANYVIKVTLTSYFLMSYRQINIEELNKSKAANNESNK